MDRQLLKASLRVLMDLQSLGGANPSDVDALRTNASAGENELELDDLADAIAKRILGSR